MLIFINKYVVPIYCIDRYWLRKRGMNNACNKIISIIISMYIFVAKFPVFVNYEQTIEIYSNVLFTEMLNVYQIKG